MSTSTVHTPTEQRTPEAAARRKRVGAPSLYARYVGAMLYFVGAALIAGAVVHYPIDPPVYTAICVVGALVFLLGTVVNEFIFAAVRPTVGRAVSLVTFSLLLSFGVGLLGGGIQHFEQFPERSAAMTPIGLLMSYAAFVAKDAEGRWRNLFSLFSAGVAIIAALTWFGMSALAEMVESDGHQHSDTAQHPAEDGSTGDTPADTPTADTPAADAPADDAPADDAPADDAPAEHESEHGDTQDSTGEHDDDSHEH